MSYNFTKKVAIITGGLSGIGLATAIKCLELGAKVVVSDIKPVSDANVVLKSIMEKGLDQKKILYTQADSSISEDNEKLIESTLEKFGDLDFVFANAGIATFQTAADLTPIEWKKVIDVNLNGVFYLNHYAINYWLKNNKKGAIVNTGSIHSFVGRQGLAHYSASKGGVRLLTETLAIEYAARGIRVNSVNPAYIETPLLDFLPTDEFNKLKKLHPIGRLGKPEEVANTVAFLLSDESSFINGISLLVDGGYTAQ